MEGLKTYRVSNRRYRNRRIGDFLKEIHLTEGRNTGFKKILDALEANGSPKPEFETDEGRTYFISRLFIHEGFLTDNSNLLQNDETSLQQVLQKVLRKSEYERMVPVISYLEENGMITSKMVEELTGKTRTTAWRYLQKLCDVGVLQPAGKTNKSLYKLCWKAECQSNQEV